MRDFTRDQLIKMEPSSDAVERVTFCLESLFADQEHFTTDTLTDGGLTYEEIIGALLITAREN